MESLAQIPAVHIHLVLDRRLDHIAAGIDAEIPAGSPRIDEAHVIVAVRGGKAPGPTAGFHGKQDAALLVALDGIEPALDLRPTLVRDGAMALHNMAPLWKAH